MQKGEKYISFTPLSPLEELRSQLSSIVRGISSNNIVGCLFVCVGPRKRVYRSLQAYCTYPMCVQCSHFHRQEAPRHNEAGDLSSEMWNLLGEKCPVIWPKVASSTLL
jgi:hypothetical protein